MRPVHTTSLILLFLLQITLQAQSRFVALEPLNQGTSVYIGGANVHDGTNFYQVYSKGNPGSYVGVIASYSDNGDLRWSKELDLGASVHLSTVCKRSGGGLLLGGTIQHGGKATPFIVRLNVDGTVVWSRKYPSDVNALIEKILELPNGNIVLVGNTNLWEFPGDPKSLIIVVCNPAGNLVTHKHLTTTRHYAQFADAAIADNGDFIVCGNSGHTWDYFSGIVMRFRPDGQQVWKKEFRANTPSNNYSLWSAGSRSTLAFKKIKAMGNDNYLLVGYHCDQSQYGTNWTFYHSAFITINGNGIIQNEFELNADIFFLSLTNLTNGNLVLGGYHASTGRGRLLEMTPGGVVVSHTEFTMPNSKAEIVWDISNNTAGTCFISGANLLNASYREFALFDKPHLPDYCNRTSQSLAQKITVGTISEVNHGLTERSFSVSETLNGQSNCSCIEQTGFLCGMPVDSLGFTLTSKKCGSEVQMHLNARIPTDQCSIFSWEYGDGNTGSLGDSSHTYTLTGNFWVRLIKQRANCKTTVDSHLVSAVPIRIDSITPLVFCDGLGHFVRAYGLFDSLIWLPDKTHDSIFAGSDGFYSFKAYSDGGGCIYVDSVEIKSVLFIPKLPDSSFVCGGQIIDLNVDQGDSIEWENGSSLRLRQVSATGVYRVKIYSSSCLFYDSATVVIDSGFLQLNMQDRQVCEPDSALVLVTYHGDSLVWETGENSVQRWISREGKYPLAVYLGACVYRDTFTLNVDEMPAIDLGLPPLLCGKDSALLSSISPGAVHLWSTGTGSSKIYANAPGWYKLTETNGLCMISDSIFVDGFDFSLGADMQGCDPIPEFIGHFQGDADTYIWNTGETDPVIPVGPEGGLFVLTVSKSTCVLVDSIYLKQIVNPSHLTIPNVFTPDGDGHNETFRWDVGGEVLAFSVTIYNRYAQEVFHSEDQNFEWNGGHHGDQPLPAGVYYIIMDYRLPCDSDPIRYTGTVTKIH